MTGMKVEVEFGHDELLKLLPWYASGSLEVAEQLAVARHLESCAACRHALVEIEVVQSRWQLQPQPPVIDVGNGFARLMARIEKTESEAGISVAPADTPPVSNDPQPGRRNVRVSSWTRFGIWLRGLLWPSNTFLTLASMAGALLFALIGTRSWLTSDPAGYRTLGLPVTDGRVGPRDLRIVFAPSATIEQVVRLVESLDATIIDGPTEPGAFTLRLNGPDTTESTVPHVAARLRTDPAVVYVAPALTLVPND
jgi:hypothetical protein